MNLEVHTSSSMTSSSGGMTLQMGIPQVEVSSTSSQMQVSMDTPQVQMSLSAPGMTVSTSAPGMNASMEAPGMNMQVTVPQVSVQMGTTGLKPMSDEEIAAWKAQNPEIAAFNPEQVTACAPPPMPSPTSMDPSQARIQGQMQATAPALTQDQAVGALRLHVNSNCCMSKGQLKKIAVTSFQRTDAFTISIDTTCESRELRPAHKPYRGQPIIATITPDPWLVPCQPSRWYTDETIDVPLPGTEQVRPCFRCYGRCVVRCTHCHGRGEYSCHNCHGTGHVDRTVHENTPDGRTTTRTRREHCTVCHRGWVRCGPCMGTGYTDCRTCERTGTLLHYTNIHIKFRHLRYQKVLDFDAKFLDQLPPQLVAKAQGVPLWLEEVPRLFQAGPLNQERVSRAINSQADNSIAEAATKFPAGSIPRMQKLRVTGVPVYRVEYFAGKQQQCFFVYGTSTPPSVHAPGWPCCCC